MLIILSDVPTCIEPAVILFVSKSEPPTDNLSAKNVAIAFCVGIMLLLSALKVGSVENSFTTVPVPPKRTPPNANSLSPSKSKN